MFVLRELVRLMRRMRTRLARRGARWRRVRAGFRMVVDLEDPLDASFYFGSFDRALELLVRATIRPGDTSLDIGAQKGYVTLLLARASGPRGRVLSFEPDRRARNLLVGHLERNHATNVRVFDHALGDIEGESTFFLSRVLGWSSRFPNPRATPAIESSTTVATRRLDALATEGDLEALMQRLVLAKIDVEGAEMLVLRGMRETLTRRRPLLWVEVNPSSLRAAGSSPAEIEEFLLGLGYGLYRPVFRLGWPSTVRLTPVKDLRFATSELWDVVAVHERSDAWDRLAAARVVLVRSEEPARSL